MTLQESQQEDDYRCRLQASIENAPEDFHGGFNALSEGDLDQALRCFAMCANRLGQLSPGTGGTQTWRANSLACAAYCAAEKGDHENAIKMAIMAKQIGFNILGAYYYHS